MADDIDIEEHDVLDNPQIRSIFPDLSRIKIEVQNDEDEFPYEDFADYNASAPVKVEPKTVEVVEYPQIGSRIILGSKPCPTTIVPKTEPNDVSHNDEDDLASNVNRENDPTADLEANIRDNDLVDDVDLDQVNLNAVVLLEDWGPRLDRSSCFCKQCMTLFVTPNSLDAHRTVAHSLLAVVPSANRAIKSTAKNANEGLLLCNHCNKKFSDNSSLIKHLYMVMNQPTEEIVVKSEPKDSDKIVGFKCTICTSYFPSPNHLKKHVAENHRVNILNPKKYVFNPNCAFCQFHGENMTNYNLHIQSSHKNVAAGILKAGKLINYKCNLCGHLCQSKKAFARHKTKVHADMKYKHVMEKVSIDLKKNLKQGQATSVSTDIQIKTEFEKIPHQPPDTFNVKQVPISHLFKCSCNLYWLTMTSARRHLKFCGMESNAKRDTSRCTKCQRYFRNQEIRFHELQHTLTNKFKAINISSGTEYFMFQCGLCYVVFDQHTFYKHTLTCDGVSRIQRCPYCKILVSKKTFYQHINKHGNSKHKIIKCVPVNLHAKNKAPLKRKLDNSVQKASLPKMPKIENSEATPNQASRVIVGGKSKQQFLYYCFHCKSVTVQKKRRHATGECVNNINIDLCGDCGLWIFARKTSHAKLHSTSNFTLHDVVLYDYDDIIMPIPMSQFYSCATCKVRFVSRHLRSMHKCGATRKKLCNICNETFESSSFKVHYPFHEVNPPKNKVAKERPITDLMMKYESLQAIWNILYQCSLCRTVTDSYDVAVEHSQSHYSKMENFGVVLQSCDICKLAFRSDCYQRHKELHLRATLKQDSFNIFQYNYLHLHSTSLWFKMFKKLEPKILDLILSTSIYKDSRSVPMKKIQNGNNGKTVYLCYRCDRLVHADDVTKHAYDEIICSNANDILRCNTCKCNFASQVSFDDHKKNHVDIKEYRMLAFNSVDDQALLEAMLGKDKNSSQLLTDTKDIPIKNSTRNALGKVFYRCNSCKLGVGARRSIQKHVCKENVSRKSRCPYCPLVILKRLLKKHLLLHRKVYGLNSEKMHIKDFTPAKRGVTRAVVHEHKEEEDEDEEVQVEDITPTEEIKITHNVPKVVLSRCVDCDICFLNRKTILYHFDNHSKNLKTEVCQKCQLRFKTNVLPRHTYAHHVIRNLNREDFNILDKNFVRFKPNTDGKAVTDNEIVETKIKDDLNKTTADNSIDLNESANLRALFKCYLCPVHSNTLAKFQEHLNNHASNMEIDYRPCEHCGLNFASEYCTVHEKLHLDDDFIQMPIIENAIAWCGVCKVYLQNFSAYKSHKFKHRESNYRTTTSTKCATCKLDIALCNYDRHVEYFHVKNNLSIKDYYVIGAPNPYLGDRSGDVEPTTSIAVVAKKDGKVDIKEIVLYKCTECNLHLVDKTNHCHKDKVKTDGAKCDSCTFTFPISQLDTHRQLHHKANETHKIVVKALVTIYKCSKCSLSSHDYESMAFHLKHHNRRSMNKMVTHTCNVCRHSFSNEQYRNHILNFHTKADEKREEIQLIDCVIDNDENKTDLEQSETNTSKDESVPSPNTKKYKIKLYKCGDCNVCFLSQGVCYKHVLKHIALDSWEFVECKICSLQFSLMIYHKHMKKHHIDDNFNLKDILIEEYRPNSDGPPNIELYYAVDRVQSELVSTTSEVTQCITSASDAVDSVSECGQ